MKKKTVLTGFSKIAPLFPVLLFSLVLSVPFLNSCIEAEGLVADGDTDSGVTGCEEDFQCPEDMICYGSYCIPKDKNPCTETSECLIDTDCQASQYCNDNCKCSYTQNGDEDLDEECSGAECGTTEEEVTCPYLIVEPTLDFGYAQHDSDTLQSLHISNSCRNTLTISGIEIVSTSTEFRVLNPIEEPVSLTGSTKSHKIDVVYHPIDIGLDEGLIYIDSNAVNSPTKVTLVTSYKGTVDIMAEPESLDFKKVPVSGDPAKKSLIIRNFSEDTEGNAVLRVNSAYLQSGNSAIFTILNNPAPFYLAKNGEKEIFIECDPQASGEFTDTVIFESNDPDTQQLEVPLTCEGVYPLIEVTPLENSNEIDFGITPIGVESSQVLTITNTGGAILNLDRPVLDETSSEDFILDTSLFGSDQIKLEENGSINFTIKYFPQSAGADSGKIRINSDSFASELFVVFLLGDARTPEISSDPSQLDFIDKLVKTSTSQSLMLTNDTAYQVTIDSIYFEDSTNFSFGNTDQLENIVMEPDQDHSLTVTYTPLARGNLSTKLVYTTSDPSFPEGEVRINATAIAPVFEIEEKNNADFNGTLDFGQVTLDSEKTLYLWIKNEGDYVMNLENIEFITNTQDEEFSFVFPGLGQVPAGQKLEVPVTYSPVEWPGPDTASLKIITSDPLTPEKTVSLKGLGSNQYLVISDQSPLDFGQLHFGSTQTREIKLTNGGQTGTLYLESIKLTEGHDSFSITVPEVEFPFALLPDLNPNNRPSLTLTITFSPDHSQAGSEVAIDFSGMMEFKSNSYFDSTFYYDLAGKGVPCPDGCWDLDDDPSQCEYCECYYEGDDVCDNTDNDCDGQTDNGSMVTSNCNPPDNSEPYCELGICKFDCDVNFHLCDNQCKYDWSPDHCGDSCDPCSNVPLNASATCIDSEGVPACSFKCDSGYRWFEEKCKLKDSTECCGSGCTDCGDNPEKGVWVCESAECTLYCNTGYHPCDFECKDNSNINSCGDRCEPCPEIAEGGEAICLNNQCSASCYEGYYVSNGDCAVCNTVDHCGPSCINCGTLFNGYYLCTDSECAPNCNGGFYLANGACLPNEVCEEDSCNLHGNCDNSQGYINCNCFAGYIGDRCELCNTDQGYHLSSDGVTCTQSLCDPNPCDVELNEACNPEDGSCGCEEGFCQIDGLCIEDGTVNTESTCQICNYDENPTEWSLREQGSICREAAGICDIAETCDGTDIACPADETRGSDYLCRESSGDCDVDEYCDGSNPLCPENTFKPSSFVCRGLAGGCDIVEKCTGVSATCPEDTVQSDGLICRLAEGLCDVTETCDGSSPICPEDVLVQANTVCRESQGQCDVQEVCSGDNPLCPTDSFVADTVVCRESNGTCDRAEYCPGNSAFCPVDSLESASTICREADGGCDEPEYCDGVTNVCPVDEIKSNGEVCRDIRGLCDIAENCDGASKDCPADEVLPAETTCRGSNGVCDVVEKCDGVNFECPQDEFLDNSNECRPSQGLCDIVEYCSGESASCPSDTYMPTNAICRDSQGDCDVIELCTGNSPNCPADIVKDINVSCRSADGFCDVAEYCDGNNPVCPVNNFKDSSVECRAANGICDAVEYCTGSDSDCPADAYKAQGESCDDNNDCTSDDVCDGLGFIILNCNGTEYSCNDNGTCNDFDDICSCNEGYTGDYCDICDTDYQDNDNNGTCEYACSHPSIGACPYPALQTCDDSGGEALCLFTGYVPIVSGTFNMGSPTTESVYNEPLTIVRDIDEPLHEVTLTNDYEILSHEVTQAQFEAIMGVNVSYFGGNLSGYSSSNACGDDCPVDSVNFYDAVAYTIRLSNLAGLEPCYTLTNVKCRRDLETAPVRSDFMECYDELDSISSADITVNTHTPYDTVYDCEGYRLPTEAEWEYATRAGSSTPYHPSATTNGYIYNYGCSDTNLNEIAWYCMNASNTPHVIKLRQPNFWGLYDTLGNVQEWVWDYYQIDHSIDDDVNPYGPDSGPGRVTKGGSYPADSKSCRCANRGYGLDYAHNKYIGFRVARTTP